MERDSDAGCPSASRRSPVTREFCATFISAAVALCASEMKMRRLISFLSRPASAARIAIAASLPAMMSASATPTRIGSPSGLAGDRHPAAFGLNDQIVSGPVAVGTESRNRAPDQPFVFLEQPVGNDFAPLERTSPKIVYHHVSCGDEIEDNLAIGSKIEVRSEAFLVSVDREVVGALAAVVERRPPATSFVPGAGFLDLYDVSAHIAQHHRAEGPGEDSGQVEDADA